MKTIWEGLQGMAGQRGRSDRDQGGGARPYLFEIYSTLRLVVAYVTLGLTGSSTKNVVPFPSDDSTQICPPCLCTISLLMARPSPHPFFAED